MRREVARTELIDQLTRCEESGLIDGFAFRDKHVVIVQGRYAHRIPMNDAAVFLSGMMLYARAAGFPERRASAA